MTLGDFFPSEDKKQRLLENLKTGCVLYLFRTFFPRNKDKYLVIVCEETLLAFIINSKIPNIAIKDPRLAPTQVLIEASTHSFLDHDSYINCNEVFKLSLEDIEKQILPDMNRIKDPVTIKVIQAIKTAVAVAPALAPKDKKAINKALDAKLI